MPDTPGLRPALVTMITMVAFGSPVAALEEGKDEREALRACEINLCKLVVKKVPKDGEFGCSLAKTWAKDKIKEGSAAGKVSWGFGDARCTVDLKVPRSAIFSALQSQDAILQIPEHTVSCDIERKKSVTPIKLKLAPKITFKNGIAVTALINLKEVEGPTTMRGLAFAMAKLEDGVGVFHKSLVRAINHQLADKCPKVVSGG